MRNQTATARSAPADTRTARRKAGAAGGSAAGKATKPATKPASKPPARKARAIEAAPALELSPGPALLEGPTRDEMVRLRAYDRYERNGRVHGHDVDDWLAAEAEVCAIMSQDASSATAPAG